VSNVKRKKGETFESFLRRFSKTIRESGRVLQVKKIRFHQKAINKNKRRKDALRKDIQSERDYLQKIGKLPEDDYRSYNRKR